MSWPITITADDGIVELTGKAVGSPPASSLDTTGTGSPAGVVTPAGIGHRYTDTDTGAVYVAIGATDGDWIQFAGPYDNMSNGWGGTGSGLDASSLGPSIVYLVVQSGAPTTYQTPLVLDTTMTTGGLYAWDGSAYQKVALALV